MPDYHDIYLTYDVLLLTDFFEKFRTTCLAHYSLDAVHYYTAPGLAWDAALRITQCLYGSDNRYGHVPFHREQLMSPHCQRMMLIVQM